VRRESRLNKLRPERNQISGTLNARKPLTEIPRGMKGNSLIVYRLWHMAGGMSCS
jgi:hypothetical protein